MIYCFAEISPDSFQASLQKVWHFFETGGWSMVPIVLCSFAAVTLVIFKFLDLRTANVAPKELCRTLGRVEDMIAAGKLQELNRSIRTQDSVLSRICQHALLGTHRSKESAERSTESMAREEVSRLERGIPALEVIFTIAPMVGLIGTVGGLVSIFGSFGARGAGPDQAALISKGISEALNTTIAGLAVAVPCYIFQSFFSRKLEALALRMGTLTNALISAVYQTETDAPPAAIPSPPAKSTAPPPIPAAPTITAPKPQNGRLQNKKPAESELENGSSQTGLDYPERPTPRPQKVKAEQKNHADDEDHSGDDQPSSDDE